MKIIEPFLERDPSFETSGLLKEVYRVLPVARPDELKDVSMIARFEGRRVCYVEGGGARFVVDGHDFGEWIDCNEILAVPEYRQALSLLVSDESEAGVGFAEEDMPGTPVVEGDLILAARERWMLPEARGRYVPLSIRDMETIRAMHDDGRNPITAISPLGYSRYQDPRNVVLNRVRWHLRRKHWGPVLYVLKAVQPSPRWSVRAQSDAGAIFELLCSVREAAELEGAGWT